MNETGQLIEQTMRHVFGSAQSEGALEATTKKAIAAILVDQRPTYSTSGGTVRDKTKKQRELEHHEVVVLCTVIADCFKSIAPTAFGVEATIKERLDSARKYINDLRRIR